MNKNIEQNPKKNLTIKIVSAFLILLAFLYVFIIINTKNNRGNSYKLPPLLYKISLPKRGHQSPLFLVQNRLILYVQKLVRQR